MNPELITDIGDSAVLTGITLAGIVYLWLCHCKKGASALALALLCAAIIIAVAKLVFLGCTGYLYYTYEIYSPSGHTALSMAVLGTYALLVSTRLTGFYRFIPSLIAVFLIAGIAITRLLLKLHNVPEVIAGLVIGSCSLLLVYCFLRTGRALPEFNIYVLIASAVLTAVVLHGTHFPAESLIHFVAAYVKMHVPVCIHT